MSEIDPNHSEIDAPTELVISSLLNKDSTIKRISRDNEDESPHKSDQLYFHAKDKTERAITCHQIAGRGEECETYHDNVWCNGIPKDPSID